MREAFNNIIDDHQRVIESLRDLAPEYEQLCMRAIECLKGGHTIFWAGNGGSAAQAQHFSAELVAHFEKPRRGLSSIALNTDTSALTAIANDDSYTDIFSRQLEALGKEGDLAILLSTSGKSPNLIRAAEKAKAMGIFTVGLLGRDGGTLKDCIDLSLVVSSKNTARIQEAHELLGHALCREIDLAFVG